MNKEEIFLTISNLVENEKRLMGETSRSIALRDFTRVAEEYFDLHSPATLSVELKEGKYDVTVRFLADRVHDVYPVR